MVALLTCIFPPSSFSNTAAIAEYGRNEKKKSKNNNRNVTELLFSFPKGKTNGAECFFPVFCIFVVGVCIRGETLISVFSAKKRKLKGKTIEVRACMLCCSRYSLLPFPFSIVADTMTREKQLFFFFTTSSRT